jgi:glycosyltransferase involved in cell wall biosynthesis
VFAQMQAAEQLPLTLVGMNAEQVGGHGEVSNAELPGFMAKHRFFFNPIRYTSLGLSIIEAMMVGLPIVGLATTELVTVVQNGVNGFVDTRPERLADAMRALLKDPAEAGRLGEAARRTAEERFNIGRFIDDWLQALREVTA